MLSRTTYITVFVTQIFLLYGDSPPLCLPSYLVTNKIPLYYWKERFTNFGDYLSLKLVERIVRGPVEVYQKQNERKEQKLLAVGSILTFASQNDIVWGSGANGNWLGLNNYKFTNLDVRAVRGPLTRFFLMHNFAITCPEIYGDPALLMPYFFPEFQKATVPLYDYLIIPHYSEQILFPAGSYPHIIYPTEPWDKVVTKILNSKFVISSSLHGIIVAEAFGIPARWLRITEKEHVFKYIDYYLGTGRPEFQPARSISEALRMGGEKPVQCDLAKLYQAFPFEQWPTTEFITPHFHKQGALLP